jgi:hypothetical protein
MGISQSIYLPIGQVKLLHVTDSELLPTHRFPPPEGAGLLQRRDLK